MFTVRGPQIHRKLEIVQVLNGAKLNGGGLTGISAEADELLERGRGHGVVFSAKPPRRSLGLVQSNGAN